MTKYNLLYPNYKFDLNESNDTLLVEIDQF